MIDQKYKKRTTPPAIITRHQLEKIAFNYISRFDSSSNSLRQVLRRRALRAANYHDTDKNQNFSDIEKIIIKLKKSGFLNDIKFAERQVVVLCDRGFSSKIIKIKLRQKGLGKEVIINAVKKIFKESGISELSNAIQFARRKKIGPTFDSGTKKNNWAQEKSGGLCTCRI